MNEWLKMYIEHMQNFHTKPCMFTALNTRSINTYKLLQAKNYQRAFIPIKYKQPRPTHPFPKLQLYILKCRNIYTVTNNVTEKRIKQTHTHTHTFFFIPLQFALQPGISSWWCHFILFYSISFCLNLLNLIHSPSTHPVLSVNLYFNMKKLVAYREEELTENNGVCHKLACVSKQQ